MEKYIVDQRIKKSGQINESRIQKMKARFEMVERLKNELKNKLASHISDTNKYQTFMKNLLVETLLSAMEEKVQLVVRQKDVKMVEGMLAEVQKEYSQKVLAECKRKLNPNVTVHKKRFLEDHNKDWY